MWKPIKYRSVKEKYRRSVTTYIAVVILYPYEDDDQEDLSDSLFLEKGVDVTGWKEDNHD